MMLFKTWMGQDLLAVEFVLSQPENQDQEGEEEAVAARPHATGADPEVTDALHPVGDELHPATHRAAAATELSLKISPTRAPGRTLKTSPATTALHLLLRLMWSQRTASSLESWSSRPAVMLTMLFPDLTKPKSYPAAERVITTRPQKFAFSKTKAEAVPDRAAADHDPKNAAGLEADDLGPARAVAADPRP